MRIPEWFQEEHACRNLELLALDVGRAAALAQIEGLSVGLSTGWGERQVQRYLKRYPYLLLRRRRTGHGVFAFPENELGNQYRLDWAIAEGSSGGLSWELIELESPLVLPFKKNGHFSSSARGGIEHIQNWRSWLTANRDYAQRSKARNGLGLHECDLNFGFVVAGRRSHYELEPGRERYNATRFALKTDSHIELMSYDSFVESLKLRFVQSLR